MRLYWVIFQAGTRIVCEQRVKLTVQSFSPSSTFVDSHQSVGRGSRFSGGILLQWAGRNCTCRRHGRIPCSCLLSFDLLLSCFCFAAVLPTSLETLHSCPLFFVISWYVFSVLFSSVFVLIRACLCLHFSWFCSLHFHFLSSLTLRNLWASFKNLLKPLRKNKGVSDTRVVIIHL